MKLNINDTFNKELPADPNKNNTPRQVYEACYSFVTPTVPTKPELVHVSKETAELLGIDLTDLASQEFLEVFSGPR